MPNFKSFSIELELEQNGGKKPHQIEKKKDVVLIFNDTLKFTLYIDIVVRA